MSQRSQYIALAAIAAIGLALRLAHLDTESAWGDEFCSIVIDPTATFGEFMALNKFLNPDHVPLYYAFVYFWSALFGNSLLGVRLASVAVSMAAFPFLFLWGRRAGGPLAGLLVAAFYAVSPYYIFHAQGARPYAFALALSAASLYATLRCARDGGKWWTANILLNAVLVYTHLSGVFLLAAEGLCLLLSPRARFRATALWSIVLILIILPNVYLMQVPPQDPTYRNPSLVEFLRNVSGDDATNWNFELIYSYPEWPLLPASLAEVLRQARPLFNFVLTALSGILLLAAVPAIGRALRANLAMPPDRDTADRQEAVALAVLAAIVPLLLTLAISYVKEPMPMPRYTLAASFGIYIAAASGIVSLPKPSWRIAMMAAFALLYAYQSLWVIGGTARTQYIEAARRAIAGQGPGDIAIALSTTEAYFDVDQAAELLINYALGPAAMPRYRVHTLSALAEQAGCYLNARRPARPGDPAPQVWAFLIRFFDFFPLDAFEEALRRQGLRFERQHYYAGEGLTLYRIAADPTQAPPPFRKLAVNLNQHVDFGRVLEDWGIAFDTPQERAAAETALRRLFDRPPPPPGGALTYAYFSMVAGELDAALALKFAERAVAMEPQLATAHFARGCALFQLERTEDAIESFRIARDCPTDEISALIRPLLHCFIARDLACARETLAGIVRRGGFPPAGLQQALGLYAPPDLCADS